MSDRKNSLDFQVEEITFYIDLDQQVPAIKKIFEVDSPMSAFTGLPELTQCIKADLRRTAQTLTRAKRKEGASVDSIQEALDLWTYKFGGSKTLKTPEEKRIELKAAIKKQAEAAGLSFEDYVNFLKSE